MGYMSRWTFGWVIVALIIVSFLLVGCVVRTGPPFLIRF